MCPYPINFYDFCFIRDFANQHSIHFLKSACLDIKLTNTSRPTILIFRPCRHNFSRRSIADVPDSYVYLNRYGCDTRVIQIPQEPYSTSKGLSPLMWNEGAEGGTLAEERRLFYVGTHLS